jgi:hypothetical protein
MNYVTVSAVGIFPAGHYDKQLVPGVDDLDVVERKLSVKGDRNDRLHGVCVRKNFSDFHVCDLHDIPPSILNLSRVAGKYTVE